MHTSIISKYDVTKFLLNVHQNISALLDLPFSSLPQIQRIKNHGLARIVELLTFGHIRQVMVTKVTEYIETDSGSILKSL